MSNYKYTTYLAQSEHAAFDVIHTPGTAAPYSGIYRCTGCGSEVASNQHQPLPPQNHHQHTNQTVPIRWQLNVVATHP